MGDSAMLRMEAWYEDGQWNVIVSTIETDHLRAVEAKASHPNIREARADAFANLRRSLAALSCLIESNIKTIDNSGVFDEVK